jgi:signal transduction histidine kinase
MNDESKTLEERVKDLEQMAQKAVTDTTLPYQLEPLTKEIKRIDKRINELIDAVNKAITLKSVEGLKHLRKY